MAEVSEKFEKSDDEKLWLFILIRKKMPSNKSINFVSIVDKTK